MALRNPFAATKAADTVQPAPKVEAAQTQTHVLVPVATLQAIHATLQGHADNVLALLPKESPEAIEAALKAATLARLKAQGA